MRSSEGDIAWRDLGKTVGLRHPEALRGRSVCVSAEPRTFAAALLDLDGIAGRLVLLPPDASEDLLDWAAREAGAQAIICNAPPGNSPLGVEFIVAQGDPGRKAPPAADRATEWILFTSGTSGRPKLAVHDLTSLAGALPRTATKELVWSTFYDVRRYGGLQILLRALCAGSDFVLCGDKEPVAARLERMGHCGVTHVSGTPSHWRAVLMSPAAKLIAPLYIRLSGEIADQAVLDALRARYPHARIVHAFASTEAGVAFEVSDGRSGAPRDVISMQGETQMKIVDGTLRIRSPRCASRYINADATPLRDAEGFVDTGDVLELQDERYVFLGRRGGIINVGGLKVHPEEVESVLNSCVGISAARVRGRANPILGSVVVAEITLDCAQALTESERRNKIQELDAECRRRLAPHKAPAAIRIVDRLEISPAGKLARHG